MKIKNMTMESENQNCSLSQHYLYSFLRYEVFNTWDREI